MEAEGCYTRAKRLYITDDFLNFKSLSLIIIDYHLVDNEVGIGFIRNVR